MKILLLTFILFFAALAAPAQDKPSPPDVLIPLPVAAFFLEQNERAKLLQVITDSLRADIRLLEQLDSTRLKQLALEKDKQLTYEALLALKGEEADHYYKSEAKLRKDLRKERKRSKLTVIGSIVLITLALIL